MMLLLVLLGCGMSTPTPEASTYRENGWREIPSPRPDLQCWTRFNLDIICAPSLTSTHGAGL